MRASAIDAPLLSGVASVSNTAASAIKRAPTVKFTLFSLLEIFNVGSTSKSCANVANDDAATAAANIYFFIVS